MTSAAPTATSAAPNEPAIRRLLRATEVDTRMIGMIGALALIWVGFNIYTLVQTGEGLFLTPRNLWNLSVQTSSIAIMATGMVLIIVMRHIDLSVGSIIGFVSTIIGVAQVHILPVYLGLDNPAIWVIAVVDCFGDRRGDRRLSRLARRLCRHSGLHRHPRRAIVLARRGVVGDDRPDDRAARRPLRADGRGPARLDRGDGELGAGRARLRRHRVRPLRRPSEAGAISFSATADVGRICDRGRRLLCRPWRDCDRQRLSLARACRGEIRRRQQYPGAGRRPVHFDRLRDSGADRAGHRRGHDVPRPADAVWPLRLRHRRQSGSRRARRHQHQANHGAGLCADGNAGGSRGLHRFGAARTRRPTCSGSSTSSM